MELFDAIKSKTDIKIDIKPAMKLMNILIDQSRSSIINISNQSDLPLIFGFNVYKLLNEHNNYNYDNIDQIFKSMLDLIKEYEYPLDKMYILWNDIKDILQSNSNINIDSVILTTLMEQFIDKKELKYCMEILKTINDRDRNENIEESLYEKILKECMDANEFEFAKYIYNECLVEKYSYLKALCLCLEIYHHNDDGDGLMMKKIWKEIVENNNENKSEIPFSGWNRMALLYFKNGEYQELIDHYQEMKNNDIECDKQTYIALINVCCNLVNLEKGKSIHLDIVRSQNKLRFGPNSKVLQDIEVQKSLLNMYSKCGDFINTLKHWDDLKKIQYENENENERILNIQEWNCIINAHSIAGNIDDVLSLYQQLKDDKYIKPNDITFTMIIDVLNRKGMKEKAKEILRDQDNDNGDSDTDGDGENILEINNLSRSGNFEEAEKIINLNKDRKRTRENIKSSNIMWMTLLSACRRYNDIERAKRIYQHILEINGNDESSEYCQSAKLLLANIYGSIKEPIKEKQLRLEISKNNNRGFKKTPGMSFIEIDGKQHKFFAHYKGHERNKEIWAEVRRLTEIMKSEYGYVPNQRWVTRQLKPHETVESYLMGHSERLAFGLANIATPPGSKVIIGKNLRACGDCHEWFKMASKITNRLILCRDAKRFHHFENGKCSCNDFW